MSSTDTKTNPVWISSQGPHGAVVACFSEMPADVGFTCECSRLREAQERIALLEKAILDYVKDDGEAVGNGAGCYTWREQAKILERLGIKIPTE